MEWYNEDGKPKSLEQLHKDDAAKRKEEFRRENPDRIKYEQWVKEFEANAKNRLRKLELEYEAKFPNHPVSQQTLKEQKKNKT